MHLLLRRVSGGGHRAIGLLCLATVLLGVARIQAETMSITVDAVAPEGRRFQPHNQYTSLVTFKDNIYAVSYDSAKRPYIHKVSEETGRCDSAPLDHDEEDVYRAYADGHHLFSIGMDREGYVHVLGDMHHGGDPWYRRKSDNPLPERFRDSGGGQMYWVSDRPEDISSFSFLGKDPKRHIAKLVSLRAWQMRRLWPELNSREGN
jgi:hypothetical protein